MSGDVTVGALQRLSHMPSPNLNKDGGNLIAGQDYYNVLFTGGNISNVTLTNCTITMDAINNTPIGNITPSTGAFTTLSANSTFSAAGTATFGSALGYTDTGILASLTGSSNSSQQIIVNNEQSGTTASADIIVNNNNSTATTYYGNFGMNSSAFTGSGAFNAANMVYVTSTTADLAIGTTTSNAIHFVVNNGATDAMTISSAGNVTMSGTANSLGTITSGIWNGAVIAGKYGGTGVANTGKTITLGGNLIISGAFSTTLTVTAATNVTLPTTGTLVASGSANTWSALQTFGNSDIAMQGSSTGTTTLTSANSSASNYTLTLPAITDTLATLTATQTLTNKTLTNAVVGTQTAGNNSTIAASTGYADQTLLIGNASNVKCSVTTAGSSTTFTADEIVCGLALGGAAIKLGNYSQTVNLGTTGAGGMDTGTAPVSGFVSIYAIQGTSGTSILACNVTTSSGTIYSGANMPTGYTKSALLAIWPTNGSSQFVSGYWENRQFSYPNYTQVLTNGTATSYTSVSIASCVPINAKFLIGSAQANASSGSTGINLFLSCSNGGLGFVFFSAYNSATDSAPMTPFQMMLQGTLIYYYTQGSNPQANILVTGYII